MMNYFEGQELKPVYSRSYLPAVPDYYIAKTSRILSCRTSNPKWQMDPKDKMQQIDHKERGVKGKYKRATNVNLSVDVGFYKDHYDYTMSTNGQGQVSKNHMKVPIRHHRACKIAWEPLETNYWELGLTKEDWDSMSPKAKQVLEDSLDVDHADNDTSNNHITNLVWKTSLENSSHRKKRRLG